MDPQRLVLPQTAGQRVKIALGVVRQRRLSGAEWNPHNVAERTLRGGCRRRCSRPRGRSGDLGCRFGFGLRRRLRGDRRGSRRRDLRQRRRLRRLWSLGGRDGLAGRHRRSGRCRWLWRSRRGYSGGRRNLRLSRLWWRNRWLSHLTVRLRRLRGARRCQGWRRSACQGCGRAVLQGVRQGRILWSVRSAQPIGSRRRVDTQRRRRAAQTAAVRTHTGRRVDGCQGSSARIVAELTDRRAGTKHLWNRRCWTEAFHNSKINRDAAAVVSDLIRHLGLREASRQGQCRAERYAGERAWSPHHPSRSSFDGWLYQRRPPRQHRAPRYPGGRALRPRRPSVSRSSAASASGRATGRSPPPRRPIRGRWNDRHSR